MPRHRTAKVALSRSRLLDAAARIFTARGYVGTTMRAIARDAGIEAGSIYYHYRSKDELMGAVLDFGMSALISAVTDALSRLPPDASQRTRIETAIEAHVAAIIRNGDYMLAMRRVYGQVPAAAWRRHTALRERYGEVWTTLLGDARRAGVVRADVDLTLVRLFLMGGLNWTVEWYKPRGRPIAQVTRAFASVVLDGVLTAPAKRRRAAR